MRGIRSDLRERLSAIVRLRTEMGRRLRALEVREQCLRTLLRDEELPAGPSQQLPLPALSEGVRRREFVLGSLKDGHAWSLEALKEHVRETGLMTVGASERSLNITLVNLLREQRVMRLSNGGWRLRDQSTRLALALPISSGRSDPADGEAELTS